MQHDRNLPERRRRSAPALTTLLLAGTFGLASANATPNALQGAQTSADEQLEALIQEVTEHRRQDHPLPLPDGVDERYSDRLEAVSVERFELERGQLEVLLQRLLAIDRQALEAGAAIDAAVLRIQLHDRIEELRHRGYLLPLGSRSGFHFGFANRPQSVRATRVEALDDYIAKLQSFREHTRQQIALMRTGIQAGIVMPRAVLEGYEQTAAVHVVEDPAASGFAAPLQDLPESIPATDRERILRDGMAAISESVLPAYRELADFLANEYIPAARPTLGLVDLPGGRAFYLHRVHRYTTLDMTPEEVHQVGLEQVERLRAEMTEVRHAVGFEGDHLEFVEFLRTAPQFYVETPQRYLEAVAYAAKLMEGHLPELFRLLPRTPYGVRAMPAHIAPRQSAGYYDRGDADGTRAGWININTSQLYSRPLYVARALAYHEGVPGHHLQIMLTLENEDISEFRRSSGVTAFVEGWGLYAERLGGEVGLYDDPYDRFGMLSYQIWRACRLVVDTGMHALGWSRQQAIDYMAENTGMGVDPVTAEIDRHITEPGQGLAYTIGELKITELREHAAAELGARFDLREFHDVVLRNGPLPLSLLEQQVERWLQEAIAR